ncbi:NACHT domain-containing protein [Streptomyces coeruleorubidus]|uniref:NACHT domain-containing protein n=1 Tax=Streptomyces coeruleorubidus TaxID=116188 RepID=UPI00237F8B87|nr:NACHT domain-containing protein [Streptomyces coeruleorubidus]WDV55331.1 NACHT domain-containing protein [Streptomyces coeruleorubidus]
MIAMTRSRTRRAAAIYAVLQVTAAALALWLTKHFQVARMSATMIALAPTMPAAYLAWAAYRDDRREAADPGAKAAMLAAAVTAAETRQRAQLIGPGAHRIDLTFHHRLEPANNATGAAPSGRLTDIVAYYRELHPARLVVTGDAGAGKTLLVLDLLLGLLTHPNRTETDPVPVRLSLAGWDTDCPFQDWLTDQIHRQFRDRGLTAADASALVDQHRILPVLDGLDEMDTDATPLAHRRAARALQQLNAYQAPTGSAPVILTCRTDPYEQLAALDVRMREAARIQIAPVAPAQAAAYLTARSTRPSRWVPLLDTLTTAPDGPLARALSTPWRLNLAAVAYEERDADTLAYLREPGDMLALDSPTEIRDHLLSLYLPAAAHQHPTRSGRYRPDQIHRWLSHLATYLAADAPPRVGGGTDLVLHQLWPMAGLRRVRAVDLLLTAVVVLAAGVALTKLPDGASLSTAFVLFTLVAVWQASRSVIAEPNTLSWARSPARRREMLVWGLMMGLISGIGLGFATRFVFGIASGVGFGLLFLLGVGSTASLGDVTSTDPRYVVRNDLLYALATGPMIGLIPGLVLWVLSGHASGVASGIALGLICGTWLQARASRRYLIFLCCSRWRLPWRLGFFLHWAYGAGLLRVSGVAYQFRHRELQDWLAAHPRPY